MLRRLLLPATAVFWATMTFLLWRSEYGSAPSAGTPVPIAMIREKVLTAPDDSALEVMHRGNKIGFCRWAANVGEEAAAGKTSSEELPPEGMVRRRSGYTIDLEGNVSIGDVTQRARFHLVALFNTNHQWTVFTFRLAVRPYSWTIQGSAADRTVNLHYEEAQEEWERTFTFEQLRNPEELIGELGGAWLVPLLRQKSKTLAQSANAGFRWEARNDTLTIGRSQVRAYRITGRWFNQYQASALVSRVGEILRVELPGEYILVNDALLRF